MTKPKKPESISMPLSILMGKSYSKYKKVGENMMFLNKACRNMSKRELLAVIGYYHTLRKGVK